MRPRPPRRFGAARWPGRAGVDAAANRGVRTSVVLAGRQSGRAACHPIRRKRRQEGSHTLRTGAVSAPRKGCGTRRRQHGRIQSGLIRSPPQVQRRVAAAEGLPRASRAAVGSVDRASLAGSARSLRPKSRMLTVLEARSATQGSGPGLVSAALPRRRDAGTPLFQGLARRSVALGARVVDVNNHRPDHAIHGGGIGP